MGKHWESCECRKCERGRIEKLEQERDMLRADLCELQVTQSVLRSERDELRADLNERFGNETEQTVEQLTAENKRLREALESATSWLEAAAMGCDQGGSQYGDAADRARQALTRGGDDE